MKRIVCFLLALSICLSVSITAFADVVRFPHGSDIDIVAVKPCDPARAEETTWYFRNNHGTIQMRLWSITYGKWLTDWIDVGPAP